MKENTRAGDGRYRKRTDEIRTGDLLSSRLFFEYVGRSPGVLLMYPPTGPFIASVMMCVTAVVSKNCVQV